MGDALPWAYAELLALPLDVLTEAAMRLHDALGTPGRA